MTGAGHRTTPRALVSGKRGPRANPNYFHHPYTPQRFMKVSPPSLAPILRSDTQGRVLARLFTDPSRSYSLSQLVEWAGSSLPTVQREVRRAEEAGILRSEKIGPTRLVRVNPEHPLHHAVRRIVLATYGPPALIAREFEDLENTDAVLLFGSWAARYLQGGPRTTSTCW